MTGRSEMVQLEFEASPRPETEPADGPIIEAIAFSVSFKPGTYAVRNVNLQVPVGRTTTLFGPSGCGKSTLLRAFNRMIDLTPSARVSGQILYGGVNIYDRDIDPVMVRHHIGMVFQKPNPFPKSIYDNVAWGRKIHGMKGDMEGNVEKALRQAALWDEVKDRLNESGLSLSGGQQQRLCIARAIAVEPRVILMDEPTSALDPIATYEIEDLIESLRGSYTVVLVSHDMHQASRVSEYAAFMASSEIGRQELGGTIVEFGTKDMFSRPQNPRTEMYLSGKREAVKKTK